MNRARKRFMLYAMLAIGISLALLLALINVSLLTMAAEDADALTRAIAENRGFIHRGKNAGSPSFENGRPVIGMMGPDAPDTKASLRYFTCVFDENGQGQLTAYSMDAFTREESIAWAQSLLHEKEVGWTAQSYRYRIWHNDGLTYVTVIDQGRELLSFYRVLRISLIGLAMALAISFIALMRIGQRLFKPLEEEETRRARLMDSIRNDFQVPVTVMNAGVENLERRFGTSEETELLRRQLGQMTATLSAMRERHEPARADGTVSLNAVVAACEASVRPAFREKGLALSVSVDGEISLKGHEESLALIVREMFDNALKFSVSEAKFSASRESERVCLEMRNDTTLSDGTYDQAFDRHRRLANAENTPGAGIGLDSLKKLARTDFNGRTSAEVSGGQFILRVTL